MPAHHAARRRALPATATALVLALLAAMALVLSPGPAVAESECVADAAGDVEDRAADATTDLPEADILAICVEHTPDLVQVNVRLAEPTDPETDPAWADFSTAIGVALDVDGDDAEEFDVNYGRFPDGVARVAVFDHDSGEQLCTSEGRYDGVRYTLTVPRSCIGSPQQVSAAAFIFYTSTVAGQSSEGFYDEVPARPTFVGPYGTVADPATGVTRLAGLSRVDTAIEVSQDDFAEGAAGAVVLARQDLFPDALVAAPLAVAVDGPLLLTPSTALAQVVEEEIQRVLPEGGTVYLSGGTAALDEAVAAEVRALGYTVQRVAGDTRYATAVAVAEEAVTDPDVIVVADGNTFANALVGGSLAAFEGGVEIISDGSQLDQTAADYLDRHPDATVIAIGPEAAQAVPDAQVIAGEDVYATSVAVAQQRYPDADGVGLASGTNFPDGLTGGAHAARAGIPLLLTTPDVLAPAVQAHLDAVAPLADVVLYGGTAALSDQVARDAASAL